MHWTTPRRGRIASGLSLALVLGAGVFGAGVHSGCAAPPSSAGAAPPGSQEQATLATPAETQEPARDVVLITLDTLRWDALGFMGNAESKTPVLDQLAAQGVVFERAWAHNVMTLPSHANILTGRLPYEHGIRDNAGFTLPSNVPTLASTFQEAGLATAAVVSAFPLDARYGLARGFDVYDDRVPEGSERQFTLPERPGDESVAVAVEWWTQHSDKRRFLWLHLFDPHAPYEPPAPWSQRFAQNPYLGEIAAMDSYLAPLIEVLDPKTTFMAVTSDHGESLGDHGEQTHGLFAYDSTLRVPLVLWGTGVQPNRLERPAGHVDLFPTLIEAAGLDAPPSSGRSLLTDQTANQSDDRNLYFEALGAHLDRDWAPLRGVLDGRYKAIDLPVPELYDLNNDPQEQSNLASKDAARAERLVAGLPEESVWPPDRGSISEEERRKLASLGYLGGSGSSTGSGSSGPSRTYEESDDPKNLVHIDALMHQFMATYQRGDLAGAEVLARRLVREQPKMADGHYHLAQVLLDQNRLQDALLSMTQAYRGGVRKPALTRQLGLTLAEVGQPEQAVRLLSTLRDSKDPRSLNALGLVLSEAGDQDAAQQVLESIFEIDRRSPTAHETLALVAVRRGNWQAALKQARAAIDLDASLPLAWNYLGMALYNTGDKGQAIDAWQTSFEQAQDFDVLFNLGIVAAEIRQVDRARRALELFIDQAPSERYGQDIQTAQQRLRALGGATG